MTHTFDKEDINRGFPQQYIGKIVTIEKYPDYYVLLIGIINQEGVTDDRFITSGGIVDKITTTDIEKIGYEWPEKLDKPVLFKAHAALCIPFNYDKWEKCVLFNNTYNPEQDTEELFKVVYAKAFNAEAAKDETAKVFMGQNDGMYNSLICFR